MLELDCFLAHPDRAWPVIREIFYDHFGKARPNEAHEVLAAWKTRGLLEVLITQHVDNLHHDAGSRLPEFCCPPTANQGTETLPLGVSFLGEPRGQGHERRLDNSTHGAMLFRTRASSAPPVPSV
jgi:hypothetical protein